LSIENFEETLADKNNTVVVLRLVTAHDGHLLHGELLDAQGETRGRFTDWPGLVHHLERFLTNSHTTGPP
jgi:hypothetical protein